MHKVRTDTAVIEVDVAYPTDSGLLAKAITRVGATVKKIKAAGGATRTRTRDRSRSAGKRSRSIAANLKRRTGEAKDEVRRITADLAELAGTTAIEPERVRSNAKRALRRQGVAASGKLARAVADLETLLERTGKIIVQTPIRLAGDTPPGASRLVSLHDPDEHPIVKGRLGKPVEFGYKAQITDNADGLGLDNEVRIGNPPDAEPLVPAIERVVRHVGTVPGALTADRGYGDIGIDDKLTKLEGGHRRAPPQGQIRWPARDRTAALVPAAGQVAHRRRGPHLRPLDAATRWTAPASTASTEPAPGPAAGS